MELRQGPDMNWKRLATRWLYLTVTLFGAVAESAAGGDSAHPSPDWREWSPGLCAEARQENRFVLPSMGRSFAVWATENSPSAPRRAVTLA